jgi:hypothetical protein
MKKSFLSKKPMAKAGEKALKVLEVGAGTTGAAYLSNKVIGNKIAHKYHGLMFLGLGLAGAMFVEEPHVNNIAHGIGAYGVLRSTGDFILPKQKADLGLSGVGATANVVIDWDELAKQAQAKADAMVAGKQGFNGAEEDFSGIGAESDMQEKMV